MELRSFGHLHFIQAIKGGSVTKTHNVTHGQPALSFKEVTDIYDSVMLNCDDVKAERSCIDAMEGRTVKAEPDASVCSANDGDDHRMNNLDDNGFDNFTLKQIKESCKTKKRKHSEGLDSSKRKIKIEALSSLEDYGKKQMAADDLDFMETLSSWKSKLSKNMKSKKGKRIKESISTYTQEIIPVVISDEIQNGQEFPPSSGDSPAPVEVKFEVPGTYFLDWPDDYSSIVAKAGAEITHKWNLENEFSYVWKEHVDLIPLRMAWPSNMDIVVSNSELTSDQSPDSPAIEFESEECIIHPDVHYTSPHAISLVEDHNSDIYYQPNSDTDTPVILPNAATHKDLDCLGLGFRDDNTVVGGCTKDEFTAVAEVQAKPSSIIEHGLNPGGRVDCNSDDSLGNEEKQSFASVYGDKRPVNEATDELTSWDEQKDLSKMHHPERLLSTRKVISPTSQERLRKTMAESIDINNKNNLKCRGKLFLDDQIDKKNGAAEGLGDFMRPGFTDDPNQISITPKTFKRGSHPKGIFKIPRSSRPANRLGCNSVQSCSKSAIAFSKQQMHDAECLAMKLTKELKSMKDIVDDMLRSEFCLNTSLRYKVNEARMAVKNATRAEEAAKRCLSFMARDCSRFCKIMKLADGGPPSPQDVVRKEGKKIAFADETGGRLCQVKFYDDDGVSLSESN